MTEDGEVAVAWSGVPRNRTLEGQLRTDGMAVFGIRFGVEIPGVDNPFSAGVSSDRAGFGLKGWLECWTQRIPLW